MTNSRHWGKRPIKMDRVTGYGSLFDSFLPVYTSCEQFGKQAASYYCSPEKALNMKIIHQFFGGLAGAITLNVLHQAATRINKNAPRVDLVGEEALNKGLQSVGASPLHGKTLFRTTLAADLSSNAVYYSFIGRAEGKNLVARGLGYGLAAGIGAVSLTKPMGLDDEPVNKNTAATIMTVAWYTLGGLVAALTMKKLNG